MRRRDSVGAKRMRSRTVKGGVASSTALPSTLVAASKQDGDAKKAKAAVNSTFLRQFGKLVRVLIPRVFSAEMFYTAMVGVFLSESLARHSLDNLSPTLLVPLRLLTRRFSRAHVGRRVDDHQRDENRKEHHHAQRAGVLAQRVQVHFAHDSDQLCEPGRSVTRATKAPPRLIRTRRRQGLKYGLNEMSLLFRVRLTEHIYKKYMQGITFYRLSNLDGRIDNVDQLLTNDVQKFCESVVELYSNLSKPILDVLIYSAKLTSSHGAGAPGCDPSGLWLCARAPHQPPIAAPPHSAMLAYLVAAGALLTAMRR